MLSVVRTRHSICDGGNVLAFIYISVSCPFTILHPKPPFAPTGLSPNGRTIDRTRTNRLSWTFIDPNPNDQQSKAEIQWREQGSPTWIDSLTNLIQDIYHQFQAVYI